MFQPCVRFATAQGPIEAAEICSGVVRARRISFVTDAQSIAESALLLAGE